MMMMKPHAEDAFNALNQKGNVNADGSVDLVAQKVLIAFVCIYIAAFASTWGPIPWCVDAEVFPSRLRGKGMSLSAAS